MKYFIGVVPPNDIYHTIENIQTRFGDNRLEPHITLRAPVTVADETGWINAIENVCSTVSPIHISLPATGHFGNRVLFVDVQSIPFAALHDLIIKAIQPFEEIDHKQQAKEGFHPHLTLGRKWCGFTQQDFVAMKILADEYIGKEPVSFDATFVRVYYKPGGHKRYMRLKDVPLKST